MGKLILIALVPLAACGGGHRSDPPAASGPAISRDFALRGFDRVDATGSDDVDVRTGADFAVRAEGPKSLVDDLKIGLDGGKLKIGRKSQTSWGSAGPNDDQAMRIHVVMPSIRGASLIGSADLKIDAVTGDFTGSNIGAGNMTIGSLNGGNVKLSITGPGSISAAGKIDRLDADVTGPGDIRGRALKASSAKILVTGPGSIDADIVGRASVTILGPGSATLGDQADCSVTNLGPGNVRCGH